MAIAGGMAWIHSQYHLTRRVGDRGLVSDYIVAFVQCQIAYESRVALGGWLKCVYFPIRLHQRGSHDGVETDVGAYVDDSHPRSYERGHEIPFNSFKITLPQRLRNLPLRVHPDGSGTRGIRHRAPQVFVHRPQQINQAAPPRKEDGA